MSKRCCIRALNLPLALAVVMSLLRPASAEDIVIHAGTLIDGVGPKLRREISITIRDGRIAALEAGYVQPKDARVIDLSDATVLPGLIDSHTHLRGARDRDAGGAPSRSTALDGVLRSVPVARDILLAGFTSVRNVGERDGKDLALKSAIERGDIPGPRMWVSLESLGPTGGHSDSSKGAGRSLSAPRWSASVVDGADDVIKRVRHHGKRGADLIKIMPSGGVTSVGDNPNLQLMSNEEIKAAVDSAHALGLKVTAHAQGKLAIENSIRLGVDAIEHGTYSDEGTYRLFRKHDVYLVPTVLVASMMMEAVQKTPKRFDPTVIEKTMQVGPLAIDNLRDAYRAGVKIAFGTDALWAQGDRARQFAIMVNAGMTPLDVIFSATRDAADLLGAADSVGSISEGRHADIIAVDGDPLADISVLEDVKFVMKGGVIHKSWPDAVSAE